MVLAVADRRQTAKRCGVYRLRTAFEEPTTAIGILLLLLFFGLILLPILTMLVDGFVVHRVDRRSVGGAEGDFTLYYLWRVFASPFSTSLFWAPLINTLIIAAASIALSLSLGGVLAWLITRTDLIGRRWFASVLIVPYMLPAWTFALAWATIFRNRTGGGFKGWLESIGIPTPDWLAYGHLPIILIFTLHFSPFVILLLGNALNRFDSQLEDSARMLGASRLTIIRRILIPLMLPALISAATLILAKILGEFGVAYVLGLPVKVDVLATSLFRSIATRSAGTAAVLAGIVLLIGIISLWVDYYLLREARRFVTLGGKGAMDRHLTLGHWQPVALIFVALCVIVGVFIPIAVLFLSTVMLLPGLFEWSNFSLDYWIGSDLNTVGMTSGILFSASVHQAALNSLWICGTAALMAGALGIMTGYVAVRTPLKFLSIALRQITFLPYLVPGIAFAVAYLSLFAGPIGPFPALYGTPFLLVIAYMADQMPFASRAGVSSMMQLGGAPEEAARSVGAGWWRRMGRIVLPIQRQAIATGVLLPFISAIKSLSLVIILAVPGSEVLTTLAIQMLEFGYVQAANGIVLIICAIAFFGTWAVQKLLKTDLSQGLGR